jgi:signal transduction histidine kinase
LRNMRERVESLNGVFVIQSRHGGTELKAVIPVDFPSIASGRART